MRNKTQDELLYKAQH
jgi:hypothetical protein